MIPLLFLSLWVGCKLRKLETNHAHSAERAEKESYMVRTELAFLKKRVYSKTHFFVNNLETSEFPPVTILQSRKKDDSSDDAGSGAEEQQNSSGQVVQLGSTEGSDSHDSFSSSDPSFDSDQVPSE